MTAYNGSVDFKQKGREYMKQGKIKMVVFCILLILLALLVCYKAIIDSKTEQWMTIEEKYYPPHNESVLKGIKTDEVIRREHSLCAIKFNKSQPVIYSVDCDRYADFRIGESVRVTIKGNKVIKIRRK
jgi:hypothetical protein